MEVPPLNHHYDQFVMLFARHERAVRCFVRSMLPSIQDVDDVMQEVGLACWRKFGEFEQRDSHDSFPRWACVVARFEVLKHRRNRARDRLMLSEETIQLLADDASVLMNASEAERQAIEHCLERLPAMERRLLLSVHTRGDSVSQIAAQLGQSVRRLYSKVNALRDLVGQCVRLRLTEMETQDV